MSETRTPRATALPTARRTLSPTMWPNWSLMGLNPSRSSMANASGSPCRSGKVRPSTTRSGRSVARKSSASAPLPASITVMPASENSARWNRRSASSDWTTRIRDDSAMVSPDESRRSSRTEQVNGIPPRTYIRAHLGTSNALRLAADDLADPARFQEGGQALALVALEDQHGTLDDAAAAEGCFE